MKITTDKEYYSIPDGTRLLVIQTERDWEKQTVFVAEKEDFRLKDYEHPNQYWHWEERNCEGLEFSVETIETAVSHIDKHLKGYIYDSLVYRYQLALERGIEPLIYKYMKKEGLSRVDATVKAKEVNMRDIIRFCEILNEAIGEHD